MAVVDTGIVKVLLVEDDEDDFVLAQDLFSEMPGQRFALDWARSFDAGLKAMTLNQHDVCLVDYRLGARNGVDLLRAAIEGGCQSPIILLTGAGEHEVDVEAMQAGAADYLVTAQLNPIHWNRASAMRFNGSEQRLLQLLSRRGWQ